MTPSVRNWFARYEDALRLWMIALLLVFVIVSSGTLTYLIKHQDDVCNAQKEQRTALIVVINKAYTPLRPDLLSAQQLKDIEEARVRVLEAVPPVTCGV